MIKAIAEVEGPCYVRLGRSGVDDVNDENYQFELGKGVVLHEGKDVAIIATGMMVQEALKAKEELKEAGIEPTIVNIHTIKPIDEELIEKLAKTHKVLITCEEHSVIGGLGGAVAEVTARRCPARIEMIGVQDTFGESGTPQALLEKYGLNAKAIAKKVKEVLQ